MAEAVDRPAIGKDAVRRPEKTAGPSDGPDSLLAPVTPAMTPAMTSAVRSQPEAVVIGCSAGGLNALRCIVADLAADYPLPLVVVSHVASNTAARLVDVLGRRCHLPVCEAREREIVAAGALYVAPSGYHLLIEEDRTFSLSVEERLHFCRPAIDVLFESAALTYRRALVAILLTGANADGSQGLAAVQSVGGLTVVQDPASAEAPEMPQAAIAAGVVDRVLDLDGIRMMLENLSSGRS